MSARTSRSWARRASAVMRVVDTGRSLCTRLYVQFCTLGAMLAVEAPAAGAPLVQIAIASVLAGGVTIVLLSLVSGHLSGRSTLLSRVGDRAAATLGLPAWAALPTMIAGFGLAVGGFGVFWDI